MGLFGVRGVPGVVVNLLFTSKTLFLALNLVFLVLNLKKIGNFSTFIRFLFFC